MTEEVRGFGGRGVPVQGGPMSGGGGAEGLYCEVPCPGVGGGPCILRFNVSFVMVTMDTPFEQNDRQTQPCHNFLGGQ